MGKRNNNLIGFAIVFIFLVAAMTLGGLGAAAVREPFFWVPFGINVFVYGYIIREFWNHWREGE